MLCQAKLQAEIETLKAKAVARKEQLAKLEPEAYDNETEPGDVSMQSMSVAEGIMV